ncbi:type II secretion system secretin GspD [Noviherbaspirillum sp. UKPF54]|uniref:type II secretion system secretin GspD n=1 Tax=Noviherbaspirillum sp. UKPF54 TaxID=2601898 RepID=UPI00352AB1C2
MKSHIRSGGRGSWRRVGAAALILCLMTGMPPAIAQDPASNQATLNFVGADIESVIKAIGHYTRTTFIIDPRVKGTINLVSEKPVTKAQAMELLTSALRLQGFAVVRSDGVTKVVPEADAKLQASPVSQASVRGDQIATQIFRLNYESANNLVPVLRPLISPNNTINANPGNNSVVITDYADNLKRLGRIIAALDTPAAGDLDVVPIRHAVATDIAALANRLLDQGAAGGAPGAEAGRVSVLADSRTNSVIIRAPSAARANLAKSLIAKLDQQTSLPGNVHVVYLRNADAIRLAQTLRAVVASETSAQASTPQAQQQQPQQQQTGLASQGQQQGLGTGGGQLQQSTTPAALPTGGAGGFIQADPATNSLIITANEAVYRNLRAVIDQLDARRAQVYIESLIVEVTDSVAAQLGVQWAGATGDSNSSYRVGTITGFSTGGDNLISQLVARLSAGTSTSAASIAGAPSNGLNIGVFKQNNGQLGLGLLAHALAANTDTNILSMPNLITLDNEEARILVGQNVPFITGQFTTTSGSATNPFQTIERRDIGVVLRVRPQVSEGGSVKMAIYQETSAITDSTNAAGLITSKRSIETNVLVDDGQLIVLGGLIDDNAQYSNEKVPVLGDVPVLGNLFKYRKRNRAKTNLMVFLRPTVIRTNEQSMNVTADRYDFIRGIQAGAQPESVIGLPDVSAPALLPLQNGMPQGGPMMNAPRDVNGSVQGGVQRIPPVTVPPSQAPGTSPEPNQRIQ